MSRDAGKETVLSRMFLARPLKAVSAKIVARWLVIIFCALFWVAVLIFFLR
jgi:hypothetical protein